MNKVETIQTQGRSLNPASSAEVELHFGGQAFVIYKEDVFSNALTELVATGNMHMYQQTELPQRGAVKISVNANERIVMKLIHSGMAAEMNYGCPIGTTGDSTRTKDGDCVYKYASGSFSPPNPLPDVCPVQDGVYNCFNWDGGRIYLFKFKVNDSARTINNWDGLTGSGWTINNSALRTDQRNGEMREEGDGWRYDGNNQYNVWRWEPEESDLISAETSSPTVAPTTLPTSAEVELHFGGQAFAIYKEDVFSNALTKLVATGNMHMYQQTELPQRGAVKISVNANERIVMKLIHSGMAAEMNYGCPIGTTGDSTRTKDGDCVYKYASGSFSPPNPLPDVCPVQDGVYNCFNWDGGRIYLFKFKVNDSARTINNWDGLTGSGWTINNSALRTDQRNGEMREEGDGWRYDGNNQYNVWRWEPEESDLISAVTSSPTVAPTILPTSAETSPPHTFFYSGSQQITKSVEGEPDAVVVAPPTNYSLKLTIEPKGIISGSYGSIIQISTGGNCCQYGKRVPGIWFRPGSTKVTVGIGDNSKTNHYTLPNALAINERHDIEIRVSGSICTVYLNGVVAVRKTIRARSQLDKVNVYIGSPYTTAANAIISDISLTPFPVIS